MFLLQRKKKNNFGLHLNFANVTILAIRFFMNRGSRGIPFLLILLNWRFGDCQNKYFKIIADRV